MRNLQNSTKIFIGLSLFTVGSIAIGLIGDTLSPEKTEYVPVEEYLKDSNVIEADKIVEDSNSFTTENERYEYLKEAGFIASKTMSPEDEGTVIEENVLYGVPQDVTEATIYIYFDKNYKHVDKLRESIHKYVSKEDSFPIKIVYANLEYSSLAAMNYYRQVARIEQGKSYIIPAMFLVDKDNNLMWETFEVVDIPLRGDI